MNYKLVCIDMDGTLLNRYRKVSVASKIALKKAHDTGVHIVISTGRMYTDAESYSNMIGLKSPIIASNGALVKEKGSDEVIYKSVLGQEVACKLLKIFFKHNAKFTCFTPEKAYTCSKLYKMYSEYAKLSGAMEKSIQIKYVSSLKRLKEIIKSEKDNIVKCEILNINSFKLKKIRAELEVISEIELASSSRFNIEITCSGVSKGRAVEILAAYCNIKREEVITIGDSENDLSMIEYAGMGIAMGNAIPMAKHKADYITDTNNNDGVAKAIYRFIIN